jgi:hypothetical protein
MDRSHHAAGVVNEGLPLPGIFDSEKNGSAIGARRGAREGRNRTGDRNIGRVTGEDPPSPPGFPADLRLPPIPPSPAPARAPCGRALLAAGARTPRIAWTDAIMPRLWLTKPCACLILDPHLRCHRALLPLRTSPEPLCPRRRIACPQCPSRPGPSRSLVCLPLARRPQPVFSDPTIPIPLPARPAGALFWRPGARSPRVAWTAAIMPRVWLTMPCRYRGFSIPKRAGARSGAGAARERGEIGQATGKSDRVTGEGPSTASRFPADLRLPPIPARAPCGRALLAAGARTPRIAWTDAIMPRLWLTKPCCAPDGSCLI